VKNLTTSLQRYIQTIHELSQDENGVRVSDVASKRKVSKSSACIAMKSLQDYGLIRRGKDRRIFLTDIGKEHALIMENKINIIQLFLVEVMGISKENAIEDALVMEHKISIETLCSFCRSRNAADFNQNCKVGCHVGMPGVKG